MIQNIIANAPLRNSFGCINYTTKCSHFNHSVESSPFLLIQTLVRRIIAAKKEKIRNVIHPTEVVEVNNLFDRAHQQMLGNDATWQRTPMEWLDWIIHSLSLSGNVTHPVLTDACTMGRLQSLKWCKSCQSGRGADVITCDSDTESGIGIQVCHVRRNCTLVQCLDNFFSETISEVSFTSDRYKHKCPTGNPQPMEQPRLMDLFGDREKTLIIQLNPRLGNSQVLDQKEIARPDLTIHLSRYFNCGRKQIVTGHLTGYIAWQGIEEHQLIDAPDHVEELSKRNIRGQTSGHFISVTLGEDMTNFYKSDDLYPHSVRNLGPDLTDKWPAPFILFYRVASSCLDRWSSLICEELDLEEDYSVAAGKSPLAKGREKLCYDITQSKLTPSVEEPQRSKRQAKRQDTKALITTVDSTESVEEPRRSKRLAKRQDRTDNTTMIDEPSIQLSDKGANTDDDSTMSNQGSLSLSEGYEHTDKESNESNQSSGWYLNGLF